MNELDPAVRARLKECIRTTPREQWRVVPWRPGTRPIQSAPTLRVWLEDLEALLAAHAAAVAERDAALERLESWRSEYQRRQTAAEAERDDAQRAIAEHWRPMVAALEAERDAMRAGLVAAGQSYAKERDERVAVVQHALDEERTRRRAAERERDAYAAVVRAARALDTAIQWSGQDDGTVIGVYLHKPTADALHAAVAVLLEEP